MEIPTEVLVGSEPCTLRKSAIGKLDWSTFWISGGFFLLFLIIALIDLKTLSGLIGGAFSWGTHYFGLYWQVLMLLTFASSLYIGFSRVGRVRLGGVNSTPGMSTFNWVSMIMCALLAGGGAFWAAAEPLSHFMKPAPYFGVAAQSAPAAVAALSQSFLHWGFMAWAVLGSLLTVVYMYLHYEKKLPLMPRTLLYPLLGERALKGPIAVIADASAIIAVVAGTIGPVGFLGLQIAFVLHSVWGVPELDDSELDAAVRRELAGWYAPTVAGLRLLAVDRIGHTQYPQPAGYAATLPGHATPLRGVVLASEATSLSGIQGALESGEKAAAALLGDLETLSRPRGA